MSSENNKYIPPDLRRRGGDDPHVLVAGGGTRGPDRGGRQPGRSRATAPQPRSQQRERTTKAETTVRIFDSFPAMHEQVQAARYKVHKPACECGKVRKSLEQPYHDGFIILPDTQNSRPTNVYQYPIQGTNSYADAPKQAELQLRNVLFPPPVVSIGDGKTKKMVAKETFKISCAACLLMDQPNGFVGIASNRRSMVEFVRDTARLESSSYDTTWHYDHAIDSVVVKASEALALANAKTRSQVQNAKTQLVSSLRQESVKLDAMEDISIGHHLQTMLNLVGNDDDDDATFWFVMVQKNERDINNTNSSFVLDLPGGKRHLGETALECAIRETWEETSLRVTEAWVIQILQDEKERANHFFRMQPPLEQLDDETETEGVMKTLANLQVVDDDKVASGPRLATR